MRTWADWGKWVFPGVSAVLVACGQPAFSPSLSGSAGLGADVSSQGPDLSPSRRAVLPDAVSSLRIGLAVGVSEVSLQVPAGTTLQGGALPTGGNLLVTPLGVGSARLSGPWGQADVRLPLMVRPPVGERLGFKGRRYGGVLEVFDAPDRPGALTVAEQVALEDYLRGVVPAEIKASWHPEALRCQAVAARTYACANLGRRSKWGFDMLDTVSDQVYGGADAAHPATDAAISATRGVVLTWQGKPIEAYFHSSSGGETDDGAAVWDLPLPYLRGTADVDDSPNARWQADVGRSTLRDALVAMGQGISEPSRLEVEVRTPHGRARWLRISGSGREVRVDANKLRLRLGLKSTRYRVTEMANGWRFEGGGWGHGLGMSQWGAKAFADSGMSAPDILARYYPGAVWTAGGGLPGWVIPTSGR
ncbi:MAG: SpoIID/LytB domain-containing protein [Candidatus Sericytochromatia bacterium]|nr:SpoIID/LytB domain-containing protein [Candidatus Sericytochromatia bacterium]